MCCPASWAPRLSTDFLLRIRRKGCTCQWQAGCPTPQALLRPEQFAPLIELIEEPYATMVYVAMYTGLRVSELIALRWGDIHEQSITIDERYCRSDWAAPKSDASNTTIPSSRCVIERIQRLRTMVVEVKAGRAVRRHRVVKADGLDDLVFQSVSGNKVCHVGTKAIYQFFPTGGRVFDHIVQKCRDHQVGIGFGERTGDQFGKYGSPAAPLRFWLACFSTAKRAASKMR